MIRMWPVLVSLAACSRGSPPEPHGSRVLPEEARAPETPAVTAVAPRADATPGARVAAGPLTDPGVSCAYGVILPAGTDAAAARARLEASLREAGVVLLAPDAEPVSGATSAFVMFATPAELGYDAGLLASKGRGVEADAARLGAATQAVAVVAFAPLSERPVFVRRFAGVVHALAVQHAGWVFDGATYEVFAPAAFAERRPPDMGVDVHRLVVVHMVREDAAAGVFLQTIGLDRLAVPDLVVRGVSPALAERVHLVLEAAAQTLLERGAMTRDGELDVDWSALTEPAWRERADEVRRAGGTGRITLRATWSENTIPNAPPIIALALGEGDEALARRLDVVLGVPPPAVLGAEDDDRELAAARARALAELAALAPRFATGMPDGERLQVKAPFGDAGTGVEWMWVEVEAWRGDVLQGVLSSDPVAIPRLRSGARVEVRQADLFDYIHTRADGTKAGNETTRILMRRRGER